LIDRMNPIVRQFYNADDDRARADLLLRCPDNIVLKYPDAFTAACRRASFEAGELFVSARVACMLATRSEVGGLPNKLALELETMRATLAAFAAGAAITSQQKEKEA
jgi:hypothetical protein